MRLLQKKDTAEQEEPAGTHHSSSLNLVASTCHIQLDDPKQEVEGEKEQKGSHEVGVHEKNSGPLPATMLLLRHQEETSSPQRHHYNTPGEIINL